MAADVDRWLTVEDREPIRMPDWIVVHEYTTYEYIREEVSVRQPGTLTDFVERIVLQFSPTSTRITCALEVPPIHERA
jgi:hypothetical protein